VTSLGESPDGGWFAFLDDRLRSAVAVAAASDENPGDPFRGLYITDHQARALADDAPVSIPADRLAVAARLLGLDALDVAVLSVCAAPELHPRYGRLYGYLHDDVTRRTATPRLAARLLAGEGVEHHDVLACCAPGARLASVGAIRLLAPDLALALADRPIKLADRLAAFLLAAGDGWVPNGTAVRLRHGRAEAQPTGRAETVAEVARALRAQTRLPLVVCGPDALAVLAAASGTPLVLLDVRELGNAELRADATLAAALAGALLCFDGLDELGPADRRQLLEHVEGRSQRSVFVGRSPAEAQTLSDRTFMIVEVPLPPFAERREAWRSLTGSPAAGQVAAKFRLSIEQIAAGAEVGMIAARARGVAVPEAGDLDLGARRASCARLGDLATRLPVAYGWDDLVLPERQRNLLHSISAYLRHRDRVLSEWGYERTVARSAGLNVLFAGESGTGKTLAAQVLGAELGLDLFRVDLATVVSKYIGETEKNLERIFTAADGSNAILFFDEADALFGKRSEVSDSHDRHANIEVAYLLQRMEAYSGAVILATNFRRNIDEAFVRRLDFVVDFPFPEAEDRERIWQLVLPPEAPIADDVDLAFLATQFKLSGGAIRNCSLAAAFRAADADEEISMRQLVQAVAQEYAKQGRLTLEADFAHAWKVHQTSDV